MVHYFCVFGKFFLFYRKEEADMAKTKTSVRGKPSKKIVPVKGYKRKDGVKVSAHRRSTPE